MAEGRASHTRLQGPAELGVGSARCWGRWALRRGACLGRGREQCQGAGGRQWESLGSFCSAWCADRLCRSCLGLRTRALREMRGETTFSTAPALCCTWHWAISGHPLSNPDREMGPEKLGNLPEVAELVTGKLLGVGVGQ